ncbi:MAG: type II toxin-antitoxin system HipA family toxin [Myxococcota bacterium]|nr:type II toxin-antitoxin system HipA family toxin [Myxococcota bacterium]
MIARLFAHHPQGRVGMLEGGDGQSMTFRYDPGWLGDREAFPISVTLPLRPEPFEQEARTFFGNLLPEADLRRALCRRLGLSPDHDFALLAAIGGECAGALSLVPSETLDWKDEDYRELTAVELELLTKERVLPAIDGRNGLRLSLAGAQDKLPVRLDGDRILLPLKNAASTHILKFANGSFRHLPANEVLTTLIGRSLGLNVVNAELRPLRREGVCVVERYDRFVGDNGRIARLHQEDLCQALGLPSTRKYEKEGGPTFVQVLEAVRRHCTQPLDATKRLIDWLIFNALVWNADAHAKNVSILYDGSSVQITAAYDLVSTRAYQRLSQELAMSIGGESDPSALRRRHWEAMARTAGIGPGLVLRQVRELAERMEDATATAKAEFLARYGKSPAIERVLPNIRRQSRRILAQLSA